MTNLLDEFHILIDTINQYYRIVPRGGEPYDTDDAFFLQGLLQDFEKKLEKETSHTQVNHDCLDQS